MPPVEYLSVSQAAARKGVTRSAIYQALNSGKLPHTRIADKIVLKAKDVDAYTPLHNDERAGVRMGGRTAAEPKPKGRPGRPRKEKEGETHA